MVAPAAQAQHRLVPVDAALVRQEALAWGAGQPDGTEALIERAWPFAAVPAADIAPGGETAAESTPATPEVPTLSLETVLDVLVLVQPDLTRQAFTGVVADAASLLEAISAAIPPAEFPLWNRVCREAIAQRLMERRMFEEALGVLGDDAITDAAVPATTLFVRACAHHQLLQKELAKQALILLLEYTDGVPQRYRVLADLMVRDLEGLDEKSLDGVSRMMADVERRLELGRSGPGVQGVEQEILERLNELIEKMEQQAQASAAGSGSGNGQGNAPDSGAEDSTIKGTTADGNVDPKDIGRQDGWGNLPDKDQAKAKQILGNLFPPHYERAIQEFSRKSAQRRAGGTGR